MAQSGTNANGPRVNVRISKEMERYLEDLADLGIHGKNPTEVARTLLGNEIERLIRDDLISIRRNPRGET